jgi:hypothetical protein
VLLAAGVTCGFGVQLLVFKWILRPGKWTMLSLHNNLKVLVEVYWLVRYRMGTFPVPDLWVG